MIGVGSVGFPKGNPKPYRPHPYCGIYDSTTCKIWIYSIEYDAEKAASKVISSGLPRKIAERMLLSY
ncbi:hypothetical protein [Candidatus Uabimicrobium sp. HlEnr_7]|uniref:hypothetical protein n=1 Tax=Candidatus Uabimicrobium helgolandensis TaxID=3095367 RepID=UPI0035590D9E